MITINRTAKKELRKAQAWMKVWWLNVGIAVLLMVLWVNPYVILSELLIGALIELGLAAFHTYRAEFQIKANSK